MHLTTAIPDAPSLIQREVLQYRTITSSAIAERSSALASLSHVHPPVTSIE